MADQSEYEAWDLEALSGIPNYQEWIVYTLAGKTRFNPGLSKLYDSLVVPVGRVLEAAVPPPMGKNVIFVAQKPAS